MKHIAHIKIDIDTLCETGMLCTPLELDDFLEDDNLCEFLGIEDNDEYPCEEELIDCLNPYKGNYLVVNQEIKKNSNGSWSWNNKYSFEKK